MKKIIIHIVLIILLVSCYSKPVEKPVWLNKKAIVSFPADTFLFKSETKNWKAILLSFSQPVPLQINYNTEGFVLFAKNKAGITEGAAQLILSNDNHFFYYELNLHNHSYGTITDKDYRSPKTVNPDSGLHQQRIVHTIDEWRNLVYTEKPFQYFFEEEITLAPVAKNYRAQNNKPITAFYVQPGSAVSINISAVFDKQENMFIVTAGPVKDKYNNVVSNGTLVAFVYNNRQNYFRMEAALLNGFATVNIPAEKNTTYNLTARINETASQTIQLQ